MIVVAVWISLNVMVIAVLLSSIKRKLCEITEALAKMGGK